MKDRCFRAGERASGAGSGRGREAEAPMHIPSLGWKDVLYRVWDEISDDRIGTIAAGTAFFVLLSLVPTLGAIVSLYGLLADPATIEAHLADIRGYVPAAAIDLIGGELKRLSEAQRVRLASASSSRSDLRSGAPTAA